MWRYSRDTIRGGHTDGVTLLALRMLLSLPFYALTAFWLTRKEDNVRISSLFDFIGLQYISAGLERLILFLYPSFSVLINVMAFRQRISRTQYLALALTYTGIGIAYFGELRIDTGNAYFYWGSFLVFLCAVTYAMYLSGMGRVVLSVGASKFTSYSMLIAIPAVLTHYVVKQLATGVPLLRKARAPARYGLMASPWP